MFLSRSPVIMSCMTAVLISYPDLTLFYTEKWDLPFPWRRRSGYEINRGAWFLRIIMSSSRTLCCFPSVKRQKKWPFFFHSICNKTIIIFSFCDIQNNQGLGNCYRLRVITPTSTQFILDITKSSSKNCLLSFVANFSSSSLAESPRGDLQITAYK